jgi:hypothetical protein
MLLQFSNATEFMQEVERLQEHNHQLTRAFMTEPVKHNDTRRGKESRGMFIITIPDMNDYCILWCAVKNERRFELTDELSTLKLHIYSGLARLQPRR